MTQVGDAGNRQGPDMAQVGNAGNRQGPDMAQVGNAGNRRPPDMTQVGNAGEKAGAFALPQPSKEQSVGFLRNALSREGGHRAGI